MELYANQAYLHEFEGGVLVRDTRRVMPFHLDPWVAKGSELNRQPKMISVLQRSHMQVILV